MAELDDIKARATERRKRTKRTELFVQGKYLPEAEADLDRAIAIAERFPMFEDVMKHYPTLRCMEEQHAEARKELEQARADVLKLRDRLRFWARNDNPASKALADTEHYESFR